MSNITTYERFSRAKILEELHLGEAVNFVGWAELSTRTLASGVGKRCGYTLSVHRYEDDGEGHTVVGVYRAA